MPIKVKPQKRQPGNAFAKNGYLAGGAAIYDIDFKNDRWWRTRPRGREPRTWRTRLRCKTARDHFNGSPEDHRLALGNVNAEIAKGLNFTGFQLSFQIVPSLTVPLSALFGNNYRSRNSIALVHYFALTSSNFHDT